MPSFWLPPAVSLRITQESGYGTIHKRRQQIFYTPLPVTAVLEFTQPFINVISVPWHSETAKSARAHVRAIPICSLCAAYSAQKFLFPVI